MKTTFTQDGLWDQIATLGWDVRNDDIVLEVGGTVISGIHQGEEYNKKWATPYGVRKYNNDAFIVIKNLSRTPFESSKPMDREHKPPHSNETVEPETVEPQDITVNMDGGVGGSWEVQKES
jgi:hypothetical protein